MKNTNFKWGWRDSAPSDDHLMTRERMARLMRAWRRSKTQGVRNFEFKLIARANGRREYYVSAPAYRGEYARIIVATR